MKDNLITKEVQGLEHSDALLDLFELEYNSTTTLYFHPGVDSTVRVTSLSGNTIKLNRAQTFTDDTQLTFTGLNKDTGAEVTATANVNGNVSVANNTVSVDGVSGTIKVGMIVTGNDIDDDLSLIHI